MVSNPCSTGLEPVVSGEAGATGPSANVYRDIFMHAVEGIYRSTPDGRFIEVNPALARMFGCADVEEFMAFYTDIRRDFYVDPAMRTEMVRRLREEGSVTDIECLGRRRDGSTFWFSESARAVFHSCGRLAGFEGFIQDITARKWAEERYHLAMTGANEGLWEWSADDPNTYIISAAGQRLSCVHLPDNRVDKAAWRERIHPEDREPHDSRLSAFIRGETETWSCEYRLLGQDGRYRWILDCGEGVRDGRGGAVRMAGSLSDVTARREAEEALKRAYRELSVEKTRAEFASRTKSEFLANMSHELRTPLNAILGYTDIMKQQIFGPLGSERYVGYVNDIHASGRYLHDLLKDVLDLARVDAGGRELASDRVDLQKAIECAVLMQGQRKADVRVRHCASLPVLADERALKQVLVNVVNNALKYGGEKGVDIDVAQTAVDTVSVTVSDFGPGIAPDDLAHVTEPFFTGKRSAMVARQGTEGTGVGLALSKRLSEAMGGSLTIESEVGQGTNVTISLPLAPEPTEPAL
jgi:PAS domain S-box-containing protein